MENKQRATHKSPPLMTWFEHSNISGIYFQAIIWVTEIFLTNVEGNVDGKVIRLGQQQHGRTSSRNTMQCQIDDTMKKNKQKKT